MTHTLVLLRWLGLALALAVVAANALAWFRQQAPSVIETGIATVGAPFTLTDPSGRSVSDTDFRGRMVVLVFGWTRDVDVTPAVLQLLLAARARLSPKDKSFAAIFVSVDPERDGRQELQSFSDRYGPSLTVLGGSNAEIAPLIQAYRFPVARIPDAVLPNGYMLDHPAVYYVLDNDGRFRSAVPYTTDVAALTRVLQDLAE